MDRKPLSPLALTPEQIDPLIEDFRILEQGANFYYAVNPYEIVDFCLPINPEDFSPKEIDTIADNQATLYNIFYVSKDKPVLLSDYRKEFQGIDDHFNYKVDTFYGQAEVVQRFIKEGDLEDSFGGTSKGLEHIEEKFNILLAVAMGIYKLGVDRFQDVRKNHLAFNIPEIADKVTQAKLQEIFDSYAEVANENLEDKKEKNDLRSTICNRLRARSSGEKTENDISDASAIHRLIYLNCALEQAYM